MAATTKIHSLKEKIRLYYKYRISPVFYFFLKLTRKKGVNLAGFFDTPIGVAEVGRQCFLDIDQYSTLNCCIVNYDLSSHEKQGYLESPAYKSKVSKKYLFDTNIFFINADSIHFYLLNEQFVPRHQDYYNIGVFWWELEDHFKFDEGVKAVDEIYVFSDFIKQSILKTYPNKKVSKFTFPFKIPDYSFTDQNEIRSQYGLLPDDFVFFFNFDFFSVYERKNPEGLVKAFSKAFKGEKKIKLLLKTIHAQKHNENYLELKRIMKEYEVENQIIFEDGNLEKSQFMNLLNSIDCYVSLHRSEGLGIGMMEAMSLKKPVIATSYGGNMEFTNSQTALLVDYTLVEIEKDHGPYKKGYKWAEPILDDAATKMTKIVSDNKLRSELTKGAYEFILQNHTQGAFSRELIQTLASK